MSGQWHGGKGSQPRPTDKKQYDENFDKIFGKKPKQEENKKDK